MEKEICKFKIPNYIYCTIFLIFSPQKGNLYVKLIEETGLRT
jgi:hypothetical protein